MAPKPHKRYKPDQERFRKHMALMALVGDPPLPKKYFENPDVKYHLDEAFCALTPACNRRHINNFDKKHAADILEIVAEDLNSMLIENDPLPFVQMQSDGSSHKNHQKYNAVGIQYVDKAWTNNVVLAAFQRPPNGKDVTLSNCLAEACKAIKIPLKCVISTVHDGADVGSGRLFMHKVHDEVRKESLAQANASMPAPEDGPVEECSSHLCMPVDDDVHKDVAARVFGNAAICQMHQGDKIGLWAILGRS